MRIEQSHWTLEDGWQVVRSNIKDDPQLVLVFGGVNEVRLSERFSEIQSKYPSSNIVMVSTAGEIIDDKVQDNSIVSNAISFKNTDIELVEINVDEFKNSFSCGEEISRRLNHENLNHVLILSDGGLVNGDELVNALNDNLDEKVLVTGGLAADAGRFVETFVGLNQVPTSGKIVAIGFYGDSLKTSHGTKGGWNEFGPLRTITKSEGNSLYELDGKKALELYKQYLGPKASELPGSALLFPLSIQCDDGELVRTIISIDEESGAMTFAGDVPEGAKCRFMMATFDNLIDGASLAAESISTEELDEDSFVLMISCVGRKLVLDQRIEEEIEAAKDVFGVKPFYSGFYSNGEISPIDGASKFGLHNQTMTITVYQEN